MSRKGYILIEVIISAAAASILICSASAAFSAALIKYRQAKLIFEKANRINREWFEDRVKQARQF